MISRLLNVTLSKQYSNKLIWYLMNSSGQKYSVITKLPFLDYFFIIKSDIYFLDKAFPELKFSKTRMSKKYHFSEFHHRNEPVYKVELASPHVKNSVRKKMEFEHGVLLYEADISYIDLVLKDLGISEFVQDSSTISFPIQAVSSHIVDQLHPDFAPVLKLYFDFETDDREEILKNSNYKGFAKPDVARILSCSVMDAQTKQIIHFVHDDEAELLTQLKIYFNFYHHLEAWNYDGFDKYYEKRWKINNIPFSFDQYLTTDAMVIHEILNVKERMFVSLDKAGQRYVGIGKIKRVDSFYNLFLKDRKTLEIYNNRDVEIMDKLEERFGFTDIAVKLSRQPEVGILPQFFRFARKPSIQAIMRASMNHHNKRIVWKSKSELPTVKSYIGAITLDAVAGRHKNVIAIDLQSLYNNVMQTWNISPEQLMLNKTTDVTLVDDPQHHSYDRFDHEGIMPRVLRTFEVKRNEIKEKRKGTTGKLYETLDRVQQGLKIVLLAVTGGLGARGSTIGKGSGTYSGPKSFYSWHGASDFTAFSREILKIAIEEAKEQHFKVLYGDTDGIYLLAPLSEREYSIDDIKILMNVLVEEINKETDDFLDRWKIPEDRRKIVMETQGIYDPFVLFDKKKAYFGKIKYNAESEELFDSEDHIEIYAKGVHMVKTSTPEFIKQLQKNTFEMILQYKNQKEIEEYLNKEYAYLIFGKYDDKITFERKLTRSIVNYKANLPHIRLAEQQIAMGKMQEKGTIFYVITDTTIRGRYKVEIEGSEIFEAGRIYLWDHYVKTWLNELGQVIFKDNFLVIDPRQKDLGDWF